MTVISWYDCPYGRSRDGNRRETTLTSTTSNLFAGICCRWTSSIHEWHERVNQTISRPGRVCISRILYKTDVTIQGHPLQIHVATARHPTADRILSLCYSSETGIAYQAHGLRGHSVKNLSVAEHQCLHNIARTWWQNFTSNSEVRRRLLDHRAQPLKGTRDLNILGSLDHSIRTSTSWLPR